jgi:hypothetical protein
MSSLSATKRTSRGAGLALAGAIFLAAVLGFAFAHPPQVAPTALDFDAFYCGASVLGSGRDPYRYEPLHSCETRNMQPATPNAVVPAPLPPYAIAAFTPLARIAFPQANLAWWLLLIGSSAAIMWAVVELTSLPLLLVGICVAASVLLQALPYGALAPLPIAALTGCAVALVRSRWTLAALLLAVACIEPHMALPPLLAVFVLVPRMRVRLVVVIGALAALSLAAGGVKLNWEYFATVLPAHAVSELGSAGQYSLSSLLHAFGFSDALAVGAGSAQYAIFALLGLWLASLLRRYIPESVVLVPLACAVTGGTFVHATQVVGALPLALVIAARAQSALSWAGVTLLAIPWESIVENGTWLFGVFLFVSVLVYRRTQWAITLAASAAAALCLWVATTLLPISHQPVAIAPVAGSALAEVAWRALSEQFPPNAFSWGGHVLAYVGLACVYWATIVLTRVAGAPSQTVAARA